MMILLQIVVALFFSSMSITVDGDLHLCLNNGNYTANDAFQANLDSLLNSIATTNSSTMTYGLFNASIGPQQGSDSIEVMGYCRGDQYPDACRACLNDSAYQIRQQCPLYKQAVLFVDNCTVKYSNGSMYGVVSTSPSQALENWNDATNWDVVAKELKQLLDDLRSRAASGGPLQKYAEGNTTADLYTLYATVQCSPDLSNQQCVDCLVDVTNALPPGKIGARVWTQSCEVRYEDFRYFDPIASTLTSPPLSAMTVPPVLTKPVTKSPLKAWIIVLVSIASAVVLVGITAFLTAKRNRYSRQRLISRRDEDADEIILEESLQFSLDVIRDATDNFSEANKLGQGGFGSVFLGKLLKGQEIAVKRLSKNSGQGQMEFKNEVVLLARLQHRNLVRLLGFCLEGDERLLVYEFVPNLSLDQFIFDPLKRRSLNWDIRRKIIMGIARGLMYLHEDSRLRIIHRDLKASNILLDADMNPKVSDFGMAKLFELDQTQADTSRIVGTYGYMAPEYVLHGHFSVKSDVFSFGILVLEIVSGRRNLDTLAGENPDILISQIWRDWREEKISNIIDPLVKLGYSADILKYIHIGLLRVQENVTRRPTMASIVLMLNSHSPTLPIPMQPAFFMASKNSSTLNSTSNTGAPITQPYPR